MEDINDSPTPTEVSEWIKKHKNVEIAPEGVGLYARRIGYYSEKKSVDGETKRLLKPTEE